MTPPHVSSPMLFSLDIPMDFHLSSKYYVYVSILYA